MDMQVGFPPPPPPPSIPRQAHNPQQDDAYHESILRFVPLLLRSYLANPHMHYAVFIHKAEVLSEDYRGENFAEIQRAFAEELEDYPYASLQSLGLSAQLDFSDPHTTGQIIEHLQGEVRFDMTSVHDVTLRDAWGKVIQETMEMLPEVEQLLFSFNAVRPVCASPSGADRPRQAGWTTRTSSTSTPVLW